MNKSSTSTESIYVDIEISFIQQLRLIHALSESDFEIIVSDKDAPKLTLLREKFDMDFKTGHHQGLPLSEFTEIHHKKTPATIVGDIHRILVFPHAIVNYCHSLWNEDRAYRYTFAGLMTKARKAVITGWVKRNTTAKRARLNNADSFINRVKKKLYHTLNIDDSVYRHLGDLTIWSSTRGRKYPKKAWDDEYYKFLANSEFVLCPSGNSVWSYRFFESILCGAIPIVEESCPAYEGFRYYYMDDDARKLKWTQEDAAHNYALCLKRNTISIDEMNNELRSELKSQLS